MVLLDVTKSCVPSTVHDSHLRSRDIFIPIIAFALAEGDIRAGSHAHLAGADR